MFPPLPTPFPLATLPGTPSEWLSLFGRTHVILIHFPIALLLMAALGEIHARLRPHRPTWTTPTLLTGTLGAIASASLGWLLVLHDGYDPSTTLTYHQYLGTATALLAILTLAFHWPRRHTTPRWWTTALLLLTAATVTLTGHLGGTLVHGNLFTPQ